MRIICLSHVFALINLRVYVALAVYVEVIIHLHC